MSILRGFCVGLISQVTYLLRHMFYILYLSKYHQTDENIETTNRKSIR